MRITNQMILSRSLASIQQGLQDSARLERQITTGQKYQAVSEAPVVARSVLDLDGDLRASEQYDRTIESARSRLHIADDALQSLTNLLSRAREIAVQQGGTVATPETREAARLEVQQLRDSAVQLANQRLNGAYVFGGAYVDRVPLDPTGALDPTFPARGAQRYEIASGVQALGAPDAGEVFIDTNAMGALDLLEIGLVLDDPVQIQAAITTIADSIASVQEVVAEVGARQVRLDVAQQTQSIVDQSRLARRSTLIDTPIEEAITELASLQSTYQASLLTTSRLLETSLVNFLR